MMKKRFNNTALRTLLLGAIAVTLSHCGVFKDRSDETRLFLDTPNNFDRFNMVSNRKPSKKKGDKESKEVSEASNTEKIESAADNGAILIYRSSANEDNPKVQYATKFLTEHSSLAPLRSEAGEAYTLLDLYEKSAEIVFPGGADAGAYFFHRNAELSGTSNLVFALPEKGLDKFGLEEKSWNGVKSTLQKECSVDVESLMIQSQVKFDLNDVSFRDFEVGMEFLDEQYEDLDEDKLKFEHLSESIKSELGNAFDPSIVESQSNVSSFVIICPDEDPKAWRISQDQYTKPEKLSQEDDHLTMVFKHKVNRDDLEHIDLNDSDTILDLVLKSANDQNLKVFTRDEYVQEEKINIPSINDIASAIRKGREDGTLASAEKTTTNQSVDTNNAIAKNDNTDNTLTPKKEYTELQKQILSKPKRNSRPGSTRAFRPGNTTSSHTQSTSTEAFTPTKKSMEIVAGNDDAYTSLTSSIEGWNGSFIPGGDPFFSTILKRVSHVLYEGSTYIPDGSPYLYNVNGGLYTPHSMMWKQEYFKKPQSLSNADAESLCGNYPLSRTITINTTLSQPKEAFDKSYLQIAGEGKSLSEVVLDELWVDARPSNAEYTDASDSEKTGGKESEHVNASATKMIVYGAFAHRNDLPTDPLKNNQKMHLKFCMDPDSGQYEILWKSQETELQWNDDINWGYRHVRKPEYIVDALAGNFSKDNPLVPNQKPWFKATKDIIIDTQGESYQTLASLADSSPHKKVLINRGTKSPTQTKIVCSDKVKKCFLVFQATMMRGINPAMLSFYITPPAVLDKGYKNSIANSALHKAIYATALKRMIATYEKGEARKNEFTVYGAIELDDLDNPNKQVRYWSLSDLSNAGIFEPKDTEIKSEGTVYFVGDTPDFYLPASIEDASGISTDDVM